ncbi:MAG: hypothetical protein F6K30_28600 [Cyanothece sp. SIO2G6]|nr:hypothetical protein [Cyanothece sp. SIO2G6]
MGSKDCDRSGSPVQGIPVPGPQIPKQPVPAEIMPKSFNINALDQDAIAPFLGLPSAPSQAIQISQVPFARVGNEILQLQSYLEDAFNVQ